jgi:signal transduction histidine kinase
MRGLKPAHGLAPGLRACTTIWLLITVAAGVLVPARLVSAQEQKQVLVLYSNRRDARIVTVGDRELPRILNAGHPNGVDYYSEFIDQVRLSDTDYIAAFRNFLRLKYGGHAFDLVIAMDDNSREFLEKTRQELFPTVPVVFFSLRRGPPGLPNSTGVVGELNLAETLALATQLQPDTRHVFVVSGAETANIINEAVARAQFVPYETHLEFTYLTGLTTEALEARLAALPEHSIVYYLVVYRDGQGESVEPIAYLDRVAAAASVPTYCWVDSAIDHGIVGGSLRSQAAQVEAVGEMALRVLRGEAVESIPVATVDLNVRQIDWRQLRRWGISESRIPPGTRVLFREPTVWDRYRFYILGALVVLLAQTALIGRLLVQRSRRRRAEARLVASQAKLRSSYQQISDLGGRLIQAQEDERARIARELHDDVGQQIALVVTDLQRAADLGERFARAALSRAHGLAKSVHDLSHRLHPVKLRLLGLPAALNSLQHELSRPGTAISFTHANVPDALPQEVTLCLYRVVQEALQNAVKHSGADEIFVHLQGADAGLTATVVDDGTGFDVDAKFGKGLGLVSMTERLELVGGTLKIRSAPGSGTRLKITVPAAAAGQPVELAG